MCDVLLGVTEKGRALFVVNQDVSLPQPRLSFVYLGFSFAIISVPRRFVDLET